MARQIRERAKSARTEKPVNKKASGGNKKFHIEFKNEAQEDAWRQFQEYDLLFLTGVAGTGKTFLACAFAVEQLLSSQKKRIIMTRPIVEAGEKLGFLPGDFHEKVNPYMMPMFDCLDKLVGKDGPWREEIMQSISIEPLAFMRGRTFDDAVIILDEAQNCTFSQLKLFLTRFGENSKVIVTGDPLQSDIVSNHSTFGVDTPACPFEDVLDRLEVVDEIGYIHFHSDNIVRHPLIGKILKQLEK